MPRLCNAFATGHVWLTAVMTLIAGFPRLTCARTEGQTNAPPSASAGCCCVGGCCRTSTDVAEPQPCCRRQGNESGGPVAPLRDASHQCKGTFTQPLVFTAPMAKKLITKDQTLSSLLPPEKAPSRVLPVTVLDSWQIHLVAPPTDLVISLKHLTI